MTATTEVFVYDHVVDMMLWDVAVNSSVAMGVAVGMRAGGIRMWNCNI